MLLQILVNGLVTGSQYAILALSFAFIYNTTRTFHIAHGALYTVGAYTCYLFLRQLNAPLWVALCLAVLLSAALGAAIELSVYAPLLQRNATPLVALLSSLGLYVAIVNVIALLFGNETKVLRPEIEGTLNFGPIILTHIQLAQLAAVSFLTPTILLFLRYTFWGKVLRAVRDNETLASLLGINVQAVRVLAFALGSGIAGFAAALAALDVGMNPQVGMAALLVAATALIIGGVGTYDGPVVGGLLLGLLQSLVAWKFSVKWTDAATFSALILCLVLRPHGLLARQKRLEEQVGA